MNLYTAQQKMEYHLRKAKFNDKFEILKKINSLIDKSLTIEQAVIFICEEAKEELAELDRLEKYYENLGR